MEELQVIIIEVDDYLLTVEYDYPNLHLAMHCYFVNGKPYVPTNINVGVR